ncbi:mitochondrial ribonuclease P catalytic subunit isoform X2 [Harpegnathos saltator]|uniref:mitochondrial ribonuclease P catalytic subunit isoform X2 n=1 Tax=Harpegnathos saltator TaxID=610380 RepID=UPI000DBED288|nr:mitochondrial ribonuclease P catalytic subunit isoform X2 [Harpegnathos saltator]
MAVYHRLYRLLGSWNSWSSKYQRRVLHQESYNENSNSFTTRSRKVFYLKDIINTYPNLYNKITREDLSSTDWQTIRESILQYPPVTAITIDSTIMDLCLQEFHVDKAMEYFQFLKEHNYPLNIAIIGKYLRLFALKSDRLTDADKQEIIATYNALLKKHPYLDSITAEQCIIGLCLTDEWEKSEEIIKILKFTSMPGTTVYSAIASAAFLHDKPDVGWDAMRRILLRKLTPQEIAYTSYLRYCERSKELFDNRLEKMFTFWADNGEKTYNYILNTYAQAAKNHSWSAAPTYISKGGKCSKCSMQLSDLSFNQNIFQDLVNAFMKKVIVGSNIYYKSHPKELEKFIEFIARTKPYDVVIDGLNVTYAMTKGVAKPNTLVDVVKYFVKRKQKVLVLTRKHQKKLSVLEYIQKYAFVFWTNNLSDASAQVSFGRQPLTMGVQEMAMLTSVFCEIVRKPV